MNKDRAANGNRSLVRSSHCLISNVQSLEASVEDVEEQPSTVKEIVKLRRMYAMDFMMQDNVLRGVRQVVGSGIYYSSWPRKFPIHVRSITDHTLFYNHPCIKVWVAILGASPSMTDALISIAEGMVSDAFSMAIDAAKDRHQYERIWRSILSRMVDDGFQIAVDAK